jgi:tetratricopeptide (TPR) repeat protein
VICIVYGAAGHEESVHRESLLVQSLELEKKLENAKAFLEDSALNSYLNTVLQNINQNMLNGNYKLQIRVLAFPVFNAFALPHGSIYICTGLLAGIENEAQLAALIGHEMTHITNDHASKDLINKKRTALSGTRLQIGLDFFIGSLAGAISNVAMKSAITGYSKDLEREADSVGLVRIKAAGYAPIEFRNLFLILKQQIEKDNIKQPYFFSTHPALTERIENYYALVGNDTLRAARGKRDQKNFIRMIHPVLLVDGIMNKACGKWSVAEQNFLKLVSVDSSNYSALINLGDIIRLRACPQPNKKAFTWYRKAMKCDNSDGEALRKLGFYFYKIGQLDSASHYLTIYMHQYSSSPYIKTVKDYVSQCDK